MTADRLACAAQALEGTCFRLFGRDRETGLDCIGLVGAALAACGRPVLYPRGYRLRNADIAPWLGFARENGLRPVAGPIVRGDILLIKPGPAQQHLLVALGGDRFVHAHAGLRRVVVQQLTFPQTLRAHWRLDQDQEEPWQR